MGNATGNYADWWDLFRSMKHVQGGFIWAWADEAIRKTAADGTAYWGYGGDFGEKVHNFTFCLNGLVFPDRTPHPALCEVKHVNRPITCSLRGHTYQFKDFGQSGSALVLMVRLGIASRLSNEPLRNLVASASLEIDGEPGGTAYIDGAILRGIGPGGEAEATLHIPVTRALAFGRGDHLAVLMVCWSFAESTLWAPAGHKVAVEQLHLSLPPPLPHALSDTATTATMGDPEQSPAAAGGTLLPAAPPMPPGLHVEETAYAFTVSAADGPRGSFAVSIRKRDGQLVDMRLQGATVLEEGGVVNLYRPPCDGDLGTIRRPGLQTVPPEAGRQAQRRGLLKLIAPESGLFERLYHSRAVPMLLSYADTWHDVGLDRLTPHARSISLEPSSSATQAIFTVSVDLLHGHAVRASYTQHITVSYAAVHVVTTIRFARKTARHVPSLARLGLNFALPAEVSNASWLGRGPQENYIDRCEGAPIGVHRATMDELHTPYIYPQESGHRTETRWLALSAPQGIGLRVTGTAQTPTFGFNASRYSTRAIAAAAHTHDLKPERRVHLSVDHAMMGVGGDSAAAQTVLEPFQLKPADAVRTWGVLLSPIIEASPIIEVPGTVQAV